MKCGSIPVTVVGCTFSLTHFFCPPDLPHFHSVLRRLLHLYYVRPSWSLKDRVARFWTFIKLLKQTEKNPRNPWSIKWTLATLAIPYPFDHRSHAMLGPDSTWMGSKWQVRCPGTRPPQLIVSTSIALHVSWVLGRRRRKHREEFFRQVCVKYRSGQKCDADTSWDTTQDVVWHPSSYNWFFASTSVTWPMSASRRQVRRLQYFQNRSLNWVRGTCLSTLFVSSTTCLRIVYKLILVELENVCQHRHSLSV
jgi:hypothetical protein